LQCALIAFLAIVDDLAVLIFCDALFRTFGASIVKLFLARANPPLSFTHPFKIIFYGGLFLTFSNKITPTTSL